MNKAIRSHLFIDAGVAGALALALAVTTVVDHRLPPVIPGPTTESGRPGDRKGGGMGLLQPKNAFALRTAPKRDELVVHFGGNKQSEAAVAAGLQWLARHQAQDGSWCPRNLGDHPASVCQPDRKCQGPGGDFGFAQTGLAVLAFQAGGHYAFNGREFSDHVRRGLDWLADQQAARGSLCTLGRQQFMYEHGIAAFALAEACAVAQAEKREPNPRHLEAAKKAVTFIETQQHQDGGWRYTENPREGGDTSVSGWQVLALKSAREAGIPVRDDCVSQVETFFKRCETGQSGRTGYMGPAPSTDALTGVGMLVHQFLLGDPESELVQQATPYLAGLMERTWRNNRSGPADYYLWYNCSLAMYTADGPDGPHWQRWNNVLRDLLIGLQRPEDSGCERGSWPPSDQWGSLGGRIYSTSLAVLTLEVYYRFAKVKKS
jgi:hypothetical protein